MRGLRSNCLTRLRALVYERVPQQICGSGFSRDGFAAALSRLKPPPQGITVCFVARYSIMVLAVAVLFLSSGCALQPATLAPNSAAVSPISSRTQFSLSGRFSAKNGKDQASGQFRYSQSGRDGAARQMSLFSPLGTPLAEIVADRESATLTLSNGELQRAATLSEMLRTVIDLPVTDSMLSAWLQGLPFDAAVASSVVTERDATLERDALGRPTRFVQAGWEITISARMDDNPGAPKRMRWSLVAQPETEVRWVIDEWRD